MEAEQFEAIYRENYSALRQVARNLIRDADAAHDIVQEVFVRLWNRREELHTVLNPAAYLYKSVVNAALNYLEQNKKRRPGGDAIHLTASETSDGPLELKELHKKVSDAIEKLPPKCRAIFVLSRLEQRKNKEIAALLNLSLKTVENQMGIALKKMREDLQPFLRSDLFKLGVLCALLLFASAFLAPSVSGSTLF